MPNLKSAKKRLRRSERQREVNLITRGRMRSCRKVFLASIEEGDVEKQKAAYAAYSSALDKAAKSGVIKKNNANRNKSRAFAKIGKPAYRPASKKKPSEKKKAEEAAPVQTAVAEDEATE